MGLDSLDTRRILQAVIAAHSAGGPVSFNVVSGRLDEDGRRVLAEIAFAEDPAAEEFGIEWGRKCLARLAATAARQRSAQLKMRVNEAERAGNLREAMRLMQELSLLERGDSGPRRGVQ